MRFDPVWLGISAVMPAGILAVTAMSKLLGRQPFREAVADYQLLPTVLVAPVADVIPYVELAVAVGLLFSPLRRSAALAALGLVGLFTLAIAVNLHRGRRHLDCGCHFGRAGTPISGILLVRNAFLMLCIVPCALAAAQPREPSWIDGVTVFCGSVIGVLAYGMVGELLKLRLPQPGQGYITAPGE